MLSRLIAAAVVALIVVGVVTVSVERNGETSLGLLASIEACQSASSHLDRDLTLLVHGSIESFDSVHSHVRMLEGALSEIESGSKYLDGIQPHLVRVRQELDQKRADVDRILTLVGSIGGLSRGLTQSSSDRIPTEPLHRAGPSRIWGALNLTPSARNLAAIREVFQSKADPLFADARVEDLIEREIERDALLKKTIESPLGASLKSLEDRALEIGHAAATRNRWTLIGGLWVVGLLAYSIFALFGRIERSRDEVREINEHLEETVAQRTRELASSNQRLEADIQKRVKAEAERDNMEVELRHAQKLEAVGRLAAGIAHEINTPAQYVSDNTRFLKDSFDEALIGLRASKQLAEVGADEETRERVKREIADVDVEYLVDEVPKAIDQSLEGLERIGSIVRAMKEFCHPGKEKSPADLNAAIRTTVSVARNEWKYVADLQLDLDRNLPMIPCIVGELNQVILNMIVNSSHAIAERRQEVDPKGEIWIATELKGDEVEIRIKDSGGGIPEEIRSRVFDPFFTTKEVGRGTGQGLAIARSVIFDKHSGSIEVESTMGVGTTFRIRIPAVEQVEERQLVAST